MASQMLTLSQWLNKMLRLHDDAMKPLVRELLLLDGDPNPDDYTVWVQSSDIETGTVSMEFSATVRGWRALESVVWAVQHFTLNNDPPELHPWINGDALYADLPAPHVSFDLLLGDVSPGEFLEALLGTLADRRAGRDSLFEH